MVLDKVWTVKNFKSAYVHPKETQEKIGREVTVAREELLGL